jgi:hypothetical protein
MGYSTQAGGWATTAMGYFTTADGDYSTAMGNHASTNAKMGSFVYGDNSTATVMNAGADNEFDVRAAGGVNFYTKSDLSTGVSMPANGGLTITGGPEVLASESVAAGGTLDGLANIYDLTSGATTTTSAPASTTSHVIYVHNATGNPQTIAGAAVTNGQTVTLVYFPTSGWVVTSVY